MFISSMKNKRLQKEAEAEAEYSRRLAEWEARKADYEKEQEEYRASINQLREEFEAGHGAAIEQYVGMVLSRSQYPAGLEDRLYELRYDPVAQTVIVSFKLPSPKQVPKILEHKYVASRDIFKETREMKPKDFDAYYEDVLYQICLRTIHEVYESVYIEGVQSVVFNGWVDGVDRKTGKAFNSCVISCMASREEFLGLNLDRVDPKECFRHLKGINAGPLAQLAPALSHHGHPS